MSAQLTVSLIDDRPATRALWRRVLDRQGDLAVLDEFTDAASALAQLPDRLPAVLLVDWHLGDELMDGLELIRLLKTDHPQLCCLLITAYDLHHLPAEAARCGAARRGLLPLDFCE
jgi:DNA-binding NarL/FixJ family response regulator